MPLRARIVSFVLVGALCLIGATQAPAAPVGEVSYVGQTPTFDRPWGLAISSDGRFVYNASYGNMGTNSRVSIFRREPSTGNLTFEACADQSGIGCVLAPGLGGAIDIALSPDGKNAYAVSQVDGAIVAFARDPATGGLGFLSCHENGATNPPCVANTAGLAGATGVAVSPDGASVYVSSITSHSVVRFDRDSFGTLTPRGCFVLDTLPALNCPTPSVPVPNLAAPYDLVVSPDGKSVYAIAGTSGALTRFDRDSAGALTHRGCFTTGAGCGGGAATDGKPGLSGATGVGVSPDGSNVFVASFSSSALVQFQRDTSGAISYLRCFDTGSCGNPPVGGLGGAQNVVVSPDNRGVYASAYSSQALARFDRDPAGGTLTPLSCFTSGFGCAGGPAFDMKPGMDGARSIAISPDGRSIYITGENSDSIARFSRVADEPPACSPAAAVSTPLNTPLAIPLGCSDPNGDPFTIAFPSPPGKGALTLAAGGGSVFYTPANGATGADSFSVRGQNPWGVTGPVANVGVTITSPSPAPPTPPAPPPAKRLAATSVFRLLLQGNTFRVLTLRVGRAAKGARVAIRCTKGCKVRRSIVLKKTSGSFQAVFRGKVLRPGAVIEVRVTKAGFIGRLFRYRLLKGNFEKTECNVLLSGKLASCRRA